LILFSKVVEEMFSELFSAAKAHPKPAAKKKTAKKKPAAAAPKKKKAGPEPHSVDQECAPFDHIEEASPEPAKVATLEYDILQEEDYNEWDVEEDEFQLSDDDESNYEVSSVSRNGDEDDLEDEAPYGSIQSSPGLFMQGLKSMSSVKVEKKRPAGIAVSFDDDSWIE
jgi:hypothetical protein